MYKGLPVPFREYLPASTAALDSAAVTALCAKMDQILVAAADEVVEMSGLMQPARCPADLLNELGAFVAAPIADGDTEDVRRKKIAGAVQSSRSRCTWTDSVKVIVDAQVGGNSSIYGSTYVDDAIMCGSGAEPAGVFWFGMGGADSALEYGVGLFGSGVEAGIKGNVLVDVDDSGLTTAEVEDLKFALLDYVPAYYRVFLGYVSGTSFVGYSNGIMG